MTELRGREQGRHDGGIIFKKGNLEMQIRKDEDDEREKLEERRRETMIEEEHRRDRKMQKSDKGTR